jgi:hypothetical protein
MFALLEDGDLSNFKQCYVAADLIKSLNPESHVHLWPDKFYISYTYSDISSVTDSGMLIIGCYSATLKAYLEDTTGAVQPLRVEEAALKKYLANGTPDEIFDILKETGKSYMSEMRGIKWFYHGVVSLFILQKSIELLKNESIS